MKKASKGRKFSSRSIDYSDTQATGIPASSYNGVYYSGTSGLWPQSVHEVRKHSVISQLRNGGAIVVASDNVNETNMSARERNDVLTGRSIWIKPPQRASFYRAAHPECAEVKNSLHLCEKNLLENRKRRAEAGEQPCIYMPLPNAGYNSNQPRDWHGMWTDTGAGNGSGGSTKDSHKERSSEDTVTDPLTGEEIKIDTSSSSNPLLTPPGKGKINGIIPRVDDGDGEESWGEDANYPGNDSSDGDSKWDKYSLDTSDPVNPLDKQTRYSEGGNGLSQADINTYEDYKKSQPKTPNLYDWDGTSQPSDKPIDISRYRFPEESVPEYGNAKDDFNKEWRDNYTPDQRKVQTDLNDISEAAYDPDGGVMSGKIPSDYKKLSDDELRQRDIDPSFFNKPNSGFQAFMYENEKTGKQVVAFRGTESDIFKNPSEAVKDIGNDASQYAGKVAQQYKDAVNLARELEKRMNTSNLTYTGHSLGGGEATVASVATDTPATTFNAAYVHPDTFKQNGIVAASDKADQLVTSFYTKGDEVSWGEKVGGNLAKAAAETMAQDSLGSAYKPQMFKDTSMVADKPLGKVIILDKSPDSKDRSHRNENVNKSMKNTPSR